MNLLQCLETLYAFHRKNPSTIDEACKEANKAKKSFFVKFYRTFHVKISCEFVLMMMKLSILMQNYIELVFMYDKSN